MAKRDWNTCCLTLFQNKYKLILGNLKVAVRTYVRIYRLYAIPITYIYIMSQTKLYIAAQTHKKTQTTHNTVEDDKELRWRE